MDNSGQGPVLLLDTFQQHRSKEQVEQRLTDWAEGDGPGRPLSWFRERIASLNAQGPERSGEAAVGEAGPAFCHCAPEQVGGGPCFNTGYARGKEKLVSDLRNGPGHSVDSLIRQAFAAVDAYRADQRSPWGARRLRQGLSGRASLPGRPVGPLGPGGPPAQPGRTLPLPGLPGNRGAAPGRLNAVTGENQGESEENRQDLPALLC